MTEMVDGLPVPAVLALGLAVIVVVWRLRNRQIVSQEALEAFGLNVFDWTWVLLVVLGTMSIILGYTADGDLSSDPIASTVARLVIITAFFAVWAGGYNSIRMVNHGRYVMMGVFVLVVVVSLASIYWVHERA